ncbi:MAG: hypothetical protein R3F11_27595 [Verrucomicrobiales bacterium]
MLRNISGVNIDLTDVQFADGIKPPSATNSPRKRTSRARPGGSSLQTPPALRCATARASRSSSRYAGSLSNDGERLLLSMRPAARSATSPTMTGRRDRRR